MQGTLWEVHAKDTVLRSSRVGKDKKEVSADTPRQDFYMYPNVSIFGTM